MKKILYTDENIPVNTTYQYEDQDMQRILSTKVDEYYEDKPDRVKPDVLACVDNLNTKERKDSLKTVLQQWEENCQNKRKMALIPCNLNGNHWVGILISKNEEGNIDRAEYIDPMGSGIDGELQRQLNEVYGIEADRLTAKKLLRQDDSTSCGAYTVDNLFLLATEEKPDPALGNFAIRANHLKLIRDSKDAANKKFYELFATRQENNIITVRPFTEQLGLATKPKDAKLNVSQNDDTIRSTTSTQKQLNRSALKEVNPHSKDDTPQRPENSYILNNHKFKFHDKELNFSNFINEVETNRKRAAEKLPSKQGLEELRLHLEDERHLIDELSKCLLNIDFKREYGSIIFKDGTVSAVTGAPTPPPSTAGIPTAPPPPPLLGGIPKAPPPPSIKKLGGDIQSKSKSASICNLEKMVEKYTISSSLLPRELNNHQQVIDFLDGAKKELSKIEKAIEIELQVQDKVQKNINTFLTAQSSTLGGSDNHTKISIIKFFLHSLYRDIYVEDDVNFSLVDGVPPYEVKKDQFYQLDYGKELYTELAGKTPKELNELIGEEIGNIVEAIKDIQNKAKDPGCFDADQLVNCMKELSNIEQKAFMALKLSEDGALASFDKNFEENRSLRESYNKYPSDKCLIALSSIHLLLSLTEEVGYSNELGISEENDLEKLFFILMQSSSLELENVSHTLDGMSKKVSSLTITKALGATLENIGSNPEKFMELLTSKERVLSKDPITWLPVYAFGFIVNKKEPGTESFTPTCLLGYLDNLRSSKKIILNKKKFNQLFQENFGIIISDDTLNKWEATMGIGLSNFRDQDKSKKKSDKSTLTEVCERLLDGLKLNKEKVDKLVGEHKQKNAETQKKNLSSSIDIKALREARNLANKESNDFKKFCSNVFNFVSKSADPDNGLICRLNKINEFVQGASGSSSSLYPKKSIIKGQQKRIKQPKTVVINKQSESAKKYMETNFVSCLLDLLSWQDNNDKLQLCLTESEFLRLEQLNKDKKDFNEQQISEFKNQYAQYEQTLSNLGGEEDKASPFDKMSDQQKLILGVKAAQLKNYFLDINNIFVVNRYDKIKTFEEATKLLTSKEAVDFLKGIMYLDLVRSYKDSNFCDSTLLKNLKDEDGISKYFSNLQGLSNLLNIFFNKEETATKLLAEIQKTLQINLTADNALKVITELTEQQFKELTKMLANHPDCPSYFKEIAASGGNDTKSHHTAFQDLCKDLEKYKSIIAKTMGEEHKKEFMARGIPLDGITSIEEASNKLPSNIFARLIIDCIAAQNKDHKQISDPFELIQKLDNLDDLTPEQITHLNNAIKTHNSIKERQSDVKYFGIPQDLIDRDCVFVSTTDIDHNKQVKTKYNTLTERDLPSSQSSYYESNGFKEKILEEIQNKVDFSNIIDSESLLNNFTLVELAIIVRCLDTTNLLPETQSVIEEAKKYIGGNGEGLVKKFVELIDETNIIEAMVEAIHNSFDEYLANCVVNLVAKDADEIDMESISDDIDKGKDNIFNIIKKEIKREFLVNNALVELNSAVDSAGQTVSSPEKIKEGQTLLQLLNDNPIGTPEPDCNLVFFREKIAEPGFNEIKNLQTNILRQEVFPIVTKEATKLLEANIAKWNVEKERLKLIQTEVTYIFTAALEKTISQLKIQEKILELIYKNEEDATAKNELKAFLTTLDEKIKNCSKLKEEKFDVASANFTKRSDESCSYIEKFHKEIIEESNKIFRDVSLVDNKNSISEVTVDALFRSHFSTLTEKHNSFMAKTRPQLDNLQQNLINSYTECSKEQKELEEFIEKTKEKLNLKHKFEQEKQELNLEEIQDEAAAKLAEQAMETEQQKLKFQEAMQEKLKIEREMFIIERQMFIEGESLERLSIEKEAIGEDFFCNIKLKMQEIMQKFEAEKNRQEAEKIKAEAGIMSDIDKARTEAVTFRRLLKEGHLKDPTQILKIADELYRGEQIQLKELTDLTRQWGQ